jgi:hypothetical protein
MASSITTTQGFAQLQEARVAMLETPIPEIETVQPELQAAFETGLTLDLAYRKVRVASYTYPAMATSGLPPPHPFPALAERARMLGALRTRSVLMPLCGHSPACTAPRTIRTASPLPHRTGVYILRAPTTRGGRPGRGGARAGSRPPSDGGEGKRV